MNDWAVRVNCQVEGLGEGIDGFQDIQDDPSDNLMKLGLARHITRDGDVVVRALS